MDANPRCRSCGEAHTETFVDLGTSPLANSYPHADDRQAADPFYPLYTHVCPKCLLVQLEAVQAPEDIFSEYAYFSSYSQSWLDHCEAFAGKVTGRFGLNESSLVVELASNDGCLLQYFRERGIAILGVEPAANVARAAISKGIPTEVMFFNAAAAEGLVRRGYRADLLVANNVLAHVPDLNGFIAGMRILLQPRGVITAEFQHLLHLIQGNQFDTIYHEHFSYLSLVALERAFERNGLVLFDVEELPTHGGSLRIFACLRNDRRPESGNLDAVRAKELEFGLHDLASYRRFREKVVATKCGIWEFFLRARAERKSVVGYGAPAKGNTLLNYCGIGKDFIEFTVDRSPHKQGRLLPGTRIPIFAPEKIVERRPDYVVILPWNLRAEIMEQMACVRRWGGRFVTLIPEVVIHE